MGNCGYRCSEWVQVTHCGMKSVNLNNKTVKIIGV